MKDKSIVLDPIVCKILCGLNPETERFYISVCLNFDIAERLTNHEGWIVGRFRARKVDMYRKAGISKSTFYSKCWPELRKAKLLIEDEEAIGVFLLPFFKKKIESVEPVKPTQEKAYALRTLKRMNEVERRIIDLQRRIEQLEKKSPVKLWRLWKRQPRSEGR